MCDQLRLGQRKISVIALPKRINESLIMLKIHPPIKVRLLKTAKIIIVIIYKEDIYFELLRETTQKRKLLSPKLFHYICTKIFGYSDDAYFEFLEKWITKTPNKSLHGTQTRPRSEC